MLLISDLSINYQNNQILEEFNLVLPQGEIFALLGDSGSGKSSTLRFVAGLDTVKNGKVKLDGIELSTGGQHYIAPELRNIGMVFQDHSLFPHMNVEKNIAFGIHEKTKKQQQLKIKELLALIDLNGIEKKYPHQLSGGEQQRVALARALAPSPKLLLLDEPFSSLDKSHRNQLIIQVRSILKKTQITSILVTHNKEEASMFADKVGKIQDKRLFIE